MRNQARQTIAFSILITGLPWFLPSIVHYAWCDGDQWAMFGHDAQHTGRSTAIGPQTGDKKWKVFPSVDGQRHAISLPVLGPDGTVYVGSNENYVFAYAPDGTLKGRFLTGGDVLGKRISVTSDGTVYVASADGKLYVLNADLSEEKGQPKYFGSGVFVSAPTIAPNGTLYVVVDSLLCALNPDLSVIWVYANSQGYNFTNYPAIGPDGTIFVGNADNNLYAINPNKTVKWAYPTGGDVYSSALVAQDGSIYVGSTDNKVYAINPNGKAKWGSPFVTGGDVDATPALALDGTIYVGSEDSLLYAINPDGTRKWPTPFDTPGSSYVGMTTAAVGGDGTVYFGSEQTIYAVTPNGQNLWEFPAGDQVVSPAIGQDGTIYFGTAYYDGMLYAIGPGPGPGKPDLLIKQDSQPVTSYAIDDQYQTEPSGDQIETQTTVREVKATFQINVQNDGNATTSYVVRAEESAESTWTVVYSVASTDITQEMYSTNGHQTSNLAPGAAEIITIEMMPSAGVTIGTAKYSIVSAYRDSSDTTVRDVVKAVVTVVNPAPTVTSITPNSGYNNGSTNIANLAGTGFLSGASVKLTKSGQTDIAGTNVSVVGPTKITCAFDLNGKEIGQWDVVVTNPDGSGTLPNGFTIDGPPSVQFTSPSQISASESGTMTVTAQLSAVSGQIVTVPFTVTGTATQGTDYTITASPIAILAGQITGTVSIAITNDALDEPDETVIVTVGTPTNATLGATTLHTATILDDDPTVAGVSATHSSGNYLSSSLLTVTCQFSYPVGRTLQALLWRPTLPAGWTLGTASGDGSPEVNAGEIVFIGSLANRPINFTYQANVPAGQTGDKNIGGTVEYQLDAMANPATIAANPDPLLVRQAVYHSADYRSTFWVIDGTEVNRVLSYWRAGALHIDAAGADGFAAGSGSTGGNRHSADYRTTYWVIDGTELNRVLSYWRAGGYHVDAAGADGYAAGVSISSLSQIKGQATDVRTTPTINHSAPSTYTANSAIAVSNTFNYSGTLLSLLWRPILPNGWSLGTVTADGTVESLNGEIVWLGSSPQSPTHLTYTVNIPAGASGNQQIRGEIEYQLSGMVNPETVYAASDPLQLSPAPTVTLTAPNGGETLQGGSQYEIKWTSSGAIDHVGLFYSTDSGVSFPITIAHPTDNDGSFTWTVPTINSTTVRVKVEAMDANQNMVAEDASDADFTIQTPPPTVSFTTSSQSATENVGTMTVTAQLSRVTDQSVTVPLTISGTATDGTDYSITASPVTIPAGQTTATITITVNNDAIDELDETVIVTMGNPSNATQGATTVHTATIADDDPPPTISINDVTVTEGNSGTTNATFTVSLSSVSGQTVTVDYATANGTATSGSDYTAKSGTLTFNPGITTQSVSVAVSGDTTFELDEAFFVILSNPINATIADGQGQGTIVNDDAQPPPPYQPDGLIANKTDGVYVGDNIYTPPDPIELQTKAQTVTSGGAAAVYYVKVQNDGTNIDSLKVTAPKPPSAWTVNWFNAKAAGTNITTQVTGTGWLTGNLTTGTLKEIRVEVKALASVASGASHSVLATVTSTKDASKKDTVKATTTAYPPAIRKPDMMIRNGSDASFIGNNVYNTTGLSQTKNQTVARNASATYALRLQNDGNTTDSFKMTGPASGGGWMIQYYDAASGGTNITSSVTSAAGWSVDSLGVGETRDFRLEVTPGSSVAVGAIKAVLVTATSKSDGTKKDAVKASTKASSGRSEVNGSIGIGDRVPPSEGVQWLQAPPQDMASGMNYEVKWQVVGGKAVSHSYIVMSTDPEPTKKPMAMTEIQSGVPGTFKAWVPAPSKGHLYYQAVAIVDGKMVSSEIVYAAAE